MVTRPCWDSRWNRPLALIELALQPVIIPLAIVAYGLVEFRSGQLSHVRSLTKIVWTGKQGPSSGVVW
jgi:hypothetical protein